MLHRGSLLFVTCQRCHSSENRLQQVCICEPFRPQSEGKAIWVARPLRPRLPRRPDVASGLLANANLFICFEVNSANIHEGFPRKRESRRQGDEGGFSVVLFPCLTHSIGIIENHTDEKPAPYLIRGRYP